MTEEVGKTTSGRGRGRGRGRGSTNLKQTTLDASIGFCPTQRSASDVAAAAVRSITDDEDNVDSGSSDEAWKNGVNEIDESSDDGETLRGKGPKRAAQIRPPASSKRGRKSDNSKRFQPRVTRNHGALRRQQP